MINLGFFCINFRCIFFAFCGPELLTFVKSARVYLMRKNSWAPFKYFIVVFGFETLHTIGVAILFYAVLPNLDTLRAGMVTSGILLFPSLLSIFRSTRSSSSKKKYVTLGLDGESLLLFLIQFSFTKFRAIEDIEVSRVKVAPLFSRTVFTGHGSGSDTVSAELHYLLLFREFQFVAYY